MGERVADFPIVGVGASAGGLEALVALFNTLPPDTGMAFIVVQHLSPERRSRLTEILSRATKMPVFEADDGLEVVPNQVYVAPGAHRVEIAEGRLALLPQEGERQADGIDQFFRSLAKDAGYKAIGVVLSGALDDGTAGLGEIKARGGVTFAQDESARHESMPRHAIASGCVDYVMPPVEMAAEISRIARHPYVAPAPMVALPSLEQMHARIAQIVRRATSVDFTHYKASTLRRRINRRMLLHKLETLREYEEMLRNSAGEVEALYQDMLIGVTSFFRNPEAFDALKRQVFPQLLNGRSRNEPVRIWAPACSTGEEAYSLAMVFTECAEAAGSPAPVHIFASDINDAAIDRARTGLYPASIALDVSPERLARFFVEEKGGYRICKAVRERCIFARHNALADPPFSRVDFIACRNLLIYLEPVLQQQILRTLHFALKPGGWLWLGDSESIGSSRSLFDLVDPAHKIFTRRPGPPSELRMLPAERTHPLSSAPGGRENSHGELYRDAERVLAARYAPPGVVITTGMEIVQFRGETGAYLAPPSGLPSTHLLKMLREGLLVGVRSAILRAGEEGRTVREEGLYVKTDGDLREVSVEVVPIQTGTAKPSGFVVLFDEGAQPVRGAPPVYPLPPGGGAEEIVRLTQELTATREYLQALIEQQDATNEELQSANEEAQSSNEELQSLNEELETSKEEIQSTNEELTTVNEELSNRNLELQELNADMRRARDYAESIVASVRVPLLVLDAGLLVEKASLAFYECFKLTAAETLGKSIFELGNGQWNFPKLRHLLEQVLPKETKIDHFEVNHVFEQLGSRVMLLRACRLPQPASGRQVVVVSIEDITARSQAERALRESEGFNRSIVESSRDCIKILDTQGTLLMMTPGGQRLLCIEDLKPYIGKSWIDFWHGEDRVAAKAAVEAALAYGAGSFVGLFRTGRGEAKWWDVLVTPIRDADGSINRLLAVSRDVTERRRAELNTSLLVSIDQDLASQNGLDAIMQTVGAKVGAHLGVSACVFVEIRESGEEVEVTHEWRRDDMPSTLGNYQLAEYFTPEFQGTSRAGEVFAVTDTMADPRTASASFEALNIRSLLCVPLLKDGRWHFSFNVHASQPRDWRPDQIGLMRELTARVWTHLERVRAEEALAAALEESDRQRRLYNTVLSNTPDFIYVFGLNHRFIYANEALLTMYGRSLEETTRMSWVELGYPQWHSDMHDREIDQVIATKAPIRGEVPFTGTNGRRIYDYIFVPVIGADGEVEAVAGTTRDVTERKQAEAAQQAERKVFERIATGAPLAEILDTLLRETEAQSDRGMRCAILLLDKSGRHLHLGAAPSLPAAYLEVINGMAIGPQTGFCGAAAEERKPVICADIASTTRWAAYKEAATAHGLAACCATPIFSLEGNLLGTASMYYSQPQEPSERDLRLIDRANQLAAIIIERKLADESLKERTADLMRADRSKDEFLAMLAHELRNPLAPLRNAAEILREPASSAEERDEAQHVVDRQIASMTRMIDDLLDVARITEGRIDLRLEPLALDSILTVAASTIQASCALQKQVFTLQLPEQPVYLNGDPTRLEQVFGNILVNATKYSGEGSHITLSAEQVTEGGSPQVIVRVRDDGVGIDADLLPHVFDLFVQASRSLDREHGGLGIGLSLVRRLVKLHGGTVEAHSDGPGHGAEFVVRLPVMARTPKLPLKPTHRAVPRAREKPCRILIVDDNEDSARTLATLQKRRGHEVRTAFNGGDAVAIATEFQPEVVLLDIGLPGMDGFEVARRLRSMPSLPGVFLIAMSGYGREQDRQEALRAGFDEYLVKPIDTGRISEWLARR